MKQCAGSSIASLPGAHVAQGRGQMVPCSGCRGEADAVGVAVQLSEDDTGSQVLPVGGAERERERPTCLIVSSGSTSLFTHARALKQCTWCGFKKQVAILTTEVYTHNTACLTVYNPV